jgi:hypothetical protein
MGIYAEPVDLSRRPALEYTAAQICDALNASFEDYLLPVNFTPQATERRFRAEHLDPASSTMYALEDRVVGLVMVARRGWNARIAASDGEPDLPWQLAPETFAGQVAPVRAYALEDTAFAAIRDTPGDSFVLHALEASGGAWFAP